MGKQNNVWILSAKASYSDTKVVEGYSWDFLPPTKCIWFKWTPNSLPSCRGIFFILKVNSSHSWNSKQKVNMGGAREASLNLILYLLQWQKVIFLKPKGASLFSFSLQAWKQRSEEAPCFKAGRSVIYLGGVLLFQTAGVISQVHCTLKGTEEKARWDGTMIRTLLDVLLSFLHILSKQIRMAPSTLRHQRPQMCTIYKINN